ncbi:MAG: hypothetical protein CSB06_01945 [Bacteroidia bacterium]|nr:MAG: hypothetical protein CSB06_01945 [Bacteroidia bacterium]
MLISRDTKMVDLILDNYHLIPIISRFGIKLGFGGKTVSEICLQNDIDTDFFIGIINTFNHPENLQTDKLQKISLRQTVDYLRRSHTYFNNVKLPYIEELIGQLQWKDKQLHQKNKKLLLGFFEQYRKEVCEHTGNEEKKVFPFMLLLEDCCNNEATLQQYSQKVQDNSLSDYREHHETLNAALLDLKTIIIKYLPPADNPEISEQILLEIFRLEKDMDDHTRIEDHVLVPIAWQMEQKLRKKMKHGNA